ncbi:hypothetical protein MKW98_020857, partial [Papaver atlanticum]
MDDKFGLMLHNHNDVYTFSYDPSSSTCRGINHVTHPVRTYKYGIEFFGCCNGLVLLRHANKYGSNVLILWNPTTNECKKLPFPTFSETEQCMEHTEYGIGYNSRKKDFRVAGSFHTSVFGESQVSLNTGTYLGEVYLANSDKEDDDSNDDSDDDHYCFSDSADDDSADDGDEGEGLQHNKKKSKK